MEVDADSVRIVLTAATVPRGSFIDLSPHPKNPDGVILDRAVSCRQRGGRTWILPPAGALGVIRSRRDPVLIRALGQAHKLDAALGWRAGDGSLEGDRIAAPTNAYDRQLCRLAFLAPDLQRAILEGRRSPFLNLERLIHEPIPLSWSDQRRLFAA